MKSLFPPKASSFCQKQYRHSPTHLKNLLTTAIQTKFRKHATQIHTQIIVNGYTSHPFLFNSLLNLYSKCASINQRLLLFSTTHNVSKNVVTWTSLITQLSHSNKPFKCLIFFNQMRSSGIYPNRFTFSAVLPACAASMVVQHGEQMHSLISKHGVDSDLFVGSALLDMYGKCGFMGSAMKVFDDMPTRNLVSWNSMVVGFLLNRLYDMALVFFREVVREESVSPDQVTFSSALSACANMEVLKLGRQVHGFAVKRAFINLSYVSNSLMDMYCKCGFLDDAVMLFETVGERDIVSWNIIIMGCVHSDKLEEACCHFLAMQRRGILPDEATYSLLLHAFASFATVNQGSLIHSQVIKCGFLKNSCVSSSLITMYAKCGSMVDSFRVFEEIQNRNIVSWTAMIAAYQQHGYANQAIKLFGEMLESGITPDHIVYVCVISACSHTGRIEDGHAYFNSMEEVYGLSHHLEHYACMVDLLGRAGRLIEARNFVESMPIKPDASIWGALFGACANYCNLEIGREVAEKLFELEPGNAGNYVMLSNLYARNGLLKEADGIRRLMGIRGVRKGPGCSWIDIRNSTFVFTAHDRSHPRTDEIYELLGKLEDLVKKKGYVADTKYAINSAEGYKEQSLWLHSEKLALAFALLALPTGAPIRIMKNLRICGDCHVVMKFASEIYDREIIVRDINRFHRFSNGLCSCGDYW